MACVSSMEVGHPSEKSYKLWLRPGDITNQRSPSAYVNLCRKKSRSEMALTTRIETPAICTSPTRKSLRAI